MIKQYDIQTLKTTIDIVDLAKRLGLNPNGHDFIKSIYKEEKTPSLKLYKESGTYHCFSSGATGNIFDLYAVVQGLDTKRDFKRILEELSNMFGIYQSDIEITVKKPKLIKTNDKVDNNNLLVDGAMFDDVYKYFIGLCKLKGMSGSGVDYLKRRGFDLDILNKRQIGFVAENSYFELNQKLLATFDLEKLKQSGLYNEEGKFKGYSNSIAIPYFNVESAITNLQFRLLGDSSKQFKYLYLKNIKKTAYGLDLALNDDVLKKEPKVDTIYFTEGVFDTLILQQLEFRSIAIPSAGDNKVLSDDELLKIIARYNKLILAFDNDEAGLKLQQEFGNRLFKLGAKNILVKLFPKDVKDVNDYMLYLDKEDVNKN
jgi:DNA primase